MKNSISGVLLALSLAAVGCGTATGGTGGGGGSAGGTGGAGGSGGGSTTGGGTGGSGGGSATGGGTGGSGGGSSTGGGTGGATGGGTGGSTGGGTGGTGGSGGGVVSADGGVANLVFNELAGTGGDFVEMLNIGTATQDLGGWGFADSESDAGPKVAAAVRFPLGTQIPPGGYLLVYMESNCPDAGTLPDAGFVPCFRGESGISQGNGETVFLLNLGDQVVRSYEYPSNGGPTGQSWGRIPDGTGTFQITSRTPGAPNAP